MAGTAFFRRFSLPPCPALPCGRRSFAPSSLSTAQTDTTLPCGRRSPALSCSLCAPGCGRDSRAGPAAGAESHHFKASGGSPDA